MKSKIVLGILLSLALANFAQAQELHGSLDLTYQSKYVWRGFDVYNDKSAIQPSLDLDFFGTGFGLNILGHRANSSGHEASERWDYNFYYQNMLCPDEAHALMYRVGWMYYNYPHGHNQDADLQEAHAILSLPKICPTGIVPTYVLAKLWPSSSSSFVASNVDLTGEYVYNPMAGKLVPPPSKGTASGFAHIFMLDYPLTVAGILPDTPEQVINLHSEIVFNDGVGPAGQDVDNDWSHLLLGASTGIDLAENIVFTPGVYHQLSMDDSVNDEDETWVSLSMTYNF